LTISISI